MDYRAFGVKYKGGFPYVGAILSMYPADHGNTRGRLIAYDSITGQNSKRSVSTVFHCQINPVMLEAWERHGTRRS
jgi:hypothetical protein